jgi:glutamate-1-semialdehyde 2,1-aminomutase
MTSMPTDIAGPSVIDPSLLGRKGEAAREGRYGVEWLGHNLPERWPQLSVQRVYLRARNTGTRTWPVHAGADGGVIGLEVSGNGETRFVPTPQEVAPGAEVIFSFAFIVPFVSLGPQGQLDVRATLAEQTGASWQATGAPPLIARITTGPAENSVAADAVLFAGLACTSFYLPSGGVLRGREGRPYPLFARRASGCRVYDLEGNGWIDYVMGWGSALLGYARAEISEAIRAELGSGAVLGLPNFLELEVTQLLGDMIPCAEMTLFGKNGSDVCTAAVRIARVYTGRPNILFSGYSGWQEPFAQVFEPALGQPGHPQTAFRFPTNDLEQARALFDQHAGQIAGVILEPAAQVEGVDGPVREAAPAFLKALAELCRQNGALLIFDEIMTGFRHPGGSVQKASGVVPDLACFGKALASSMPLSVLVGRRDIMKTVSRIFYHPTYHGEGYSLAAAAAALRIYQQEDVPAQVGEFGRRLMASINELSRQVGIDGEMIGPPFRMVYRFNEPDASRRTLKRTLLQQELMKRGVLAFRGFLLPSTAHGEQELGETLFAFEAALRRVQQVSADDCFERDLEIPPIV